MIIVKDTARISEPDVLGELYREYAFFEEYGCYSCFELIPEFKAMELSSAPYLVQEEISYRDSPECFTNGNLWVAWAWDGDGHLVFFEQQTGKGVANTDCKKAYNWRWLE